MTPVDRGPRGNPGGSGSADECRRPKPAAFFAGSNGKPETVWRNMTNFETIKENRAFQRAYSRGKYYVGPVLVTYVVKKRGRALRIGITTGKKIGNAVRRNRSRRVIREAFRELSEHVAPGYDLVFVARAKTPFVKCGDVKRVMEQHLTRAGLLAPQQNRK